MADNKKYRTAELTSTKEYATEPAEAPTPKSYSKPADNWGYRKSVVVCRTCKFYVNLRCRRHAPVTNLGYPAVYENDFCGDHKMSKEQMGGY